MGRYGSFWFIMAHFGSIRVLVQPIYKPVWNSYLQKTVLIFIKLR